MYETFIWQGRKWYVTLNFCLDLYLISFSLVKVDRFNFPLEDIKQLGFKSDPSLRQQGKFLLNESFLRTLEGQYIVAYIFIKYHIM